MRSTWNEGRFGAPVFATRIPILSGGNYRMGQTAQEWYDRARKAVARFDALLARARQIAAPIERNNLLAWVGNGGTIGDPAYARNYVDQDSTVDVAREGIGAYNLPRRQNRVAELESINGDFNDKVELAEQRGGILPAGQIEIRERLVQVPGAPAPDLTVPILVGAGALVLALAVF